VDKIEAIQKVIRWLKNPAKLIKKSLKKFKYLYTKITEISNGECTILERVQIMMFLGGLSDKYTPTLTFMAGAGRDALKRDALLLRLQVAERWLKTLSEHGATNAGGTESANWVFKSKYYNCQKPGHRKAQCKEKPRQKPDKNNKKLRNQSRSGGRGRSRN
jgi:hypothetical protein